jgi:hypothetical protein
VIFTDHASGAVAAPEAEAEVVQVGDAIGQWAKRRSLVQCAVCVIEVLVLARDGHQVALVSDQGPVQQPRRQLPIQRSMIAFIRGA